MASGDIGTVLRSVETLFTVGTAAGLTDVQLLDRFVGRRDDGAEAAFAALVKRHGPMVLRVCRGELNDIHAAEDAFQATFLILARKARSIRKGGSLASWLYGVARRVARRARADRVRRIAHERRGAVMADQPIVVQEPPELVPEIQEEVDRLPGKYREPIVLCYLEGLTHEEAASQLRIPVGTVKIRLSRGRERLRGRLVRRGLAPTLIASALSASTRGAVPVPLLDMTVRAAMSIAAVRAAGVSVAVTTLVEGVLRAMFLSKLRAIAALVATSMTLIATSLFVVSALSRPVRSDQEPDPGKAQVVVQPPQKATAAQTPGHPEIGKTFVVKKSVFHQTTTQPATVQAFQWVNLYPRVSGELSALNVDIGDRVKKGQVLATIDSPDLRYELDKAKAMVNQVQAGMSIAESKIREAETALKTALAQTESATADVEAKVAVREYRNKQYKRISDLVDRQQVEERLRDEELDQYHRAVADEHAAQANVSVERAKVESAEAKLNTAKYELRGVQAGFSLTQADLHKAKTALASCTIRSPYDGVVTRRNYQVGEILRAASIAGSEPLLTIVQAKKVRVVVEIPDQDAVFLNNGDAATFRTSAHPEREFKGTISRTAFAEEEGTVRAEIDLDNADGHLRPGQMGVVTVNLEEVPDVITIPLTAVFGEDLTGSAGCYRVVESRPVVTPIKLGGRNTGGGEVEVVEGLKQGDTIIPNWRVVRESLQ